VYDPAGGLPASKILGEVTSTSAQMTLPVLSPAPQGRDFLLAVANVGTETVRLRGGADQLRPLAGNPAAPKLRAEDPGAIGPGEMAILNLNDVSGLWAGVTVHFENAADVKITWGLPGVVLSPMALIAIASIVLGGTVLAIFRRTLRDRQPS